ncbi:MAG: DegV family protein [Lachnospiraceae bacterium]|nr:DegV family protein [Lachnospiraceae bacterium]MBP5254328.1 DegV family protein [Lachnospiraceae bacterium]
MRPVKILVDSCSDMPKAFRDRYDIDYARMKTLSDGKEQWASLDFEYYTPKELYDTMRAGKRVLTTQVPMEEFERIFTKYLEQGYDIVYIGCSLKQSSSVNTGTVVAKKLAERFEGAQVFCVDSLNACMGEGLLGIRAAEYRDQGLSAEEIHARILKDRNFVNEYVTVHSLDALKRAGRVKGSAAFFGNLLGVKPIIISDANGEQTPIKKVKGRQTSLQEIVNLLAESIEKPETQTLFVMHADSEADAEKVREEILKKIPCKDVCIGTIGPIIGASIGPDAIALFGWGREVTYAV